MVGTRPADNATIAISCYADPGQPSFTRLDARRQNQQRQRHIRQPTRPQNYPRTVQAWPRKADELVAAQRALGAAGPAPWRPSDSARMSVAAAWVCFARGTSGVGGPGDPAWAAAVIMRGRRTTEQAVLIGAATGAYVPGLLALRIGPLLSDVICRLPVRPDVVLIDATGRDHPRRAGLAVHLGAMLDLPSVGITHRPLLASGEWPDDLVNASAPLFLNGETVGYWLRTRSGRRPVAVHAGWRTDAETALGIVLACKGGKRTPAPLREARRLARRSRGGSAASGS